MRIAWFTPFPPEKSAIAEYSVIIVNELQKHCDVDLWVSLFDKDDVEITESKYKGKFNITNYVAIPEFLNALSAYDVAIYNMGNNLKFHKDIFKISKLHPGIVILHDYVLHHFFVAYYLSYKNSKEDYIKDMERNYGTIGKELARDILSGKANRVWETDDVLNYPLNRSALDNATGVIVHSNFVKDKLKKFHHGLIRKLNFPTPPFIDPQITHKNKQELGIQRDKLLMLTFGEINPNKRIDKIIKILGENSELADKIIYVIIGKEHRGYYDIRPMIEKYKLNNTVRILGYQPKEVLNEFISASDIFMNLRYPTMGESSWSLIQVISAGKPAFVTRTGWYDELPDDCVIKINPDKEEDELLFHLKRLCSYKDLQINQSAQKFVQDNFSTETYYERLIDFIAEVRKYCVITNLIDTVSKELFLMGITDNFKIVDLVAEEIYKLTNPYQKV